MRLAVVGTGYVGLVAGACFADCGNDVVCVDSDTAKVETLSQGKITLYEPGLEELVVRNLSEGRLVFTTDLDMAVDHAEIIFIAVGTPPQADGSVDMGNVFSVIRRIGQRMQSRKILVLKSTVPPGTAARAAKHMREVSGYDFAIISNPEFLKEGAAIDDFTRPDRIVLGGGDLEALEVMKDLYDPFVRTGNPIMIMDNVSAEMCKYAANAMLAARISFMNEIAGLCERTGANVALVREAIGRDHRIGPNFLFPGAGYGGSCFPKDIQALIHTGREHGYPMSMLSAVEEVNRNQKRSLFDKIQLHYKSGIMGMKFAVWGLAFKPKTDDMREAPAAALIECLLDAGCSVSSYDPEAMPTARRIFGDRIEYAESSYHACENADGLAVVTEWNEFRRPDFERIRSLLRHPVVFDGRNLYNPSRMAKLKYTYYSIGRPPVIQKEHAQ